MRFLNWLKPDLQLDSVYQLDLSELRRRRIRGIIFDLDSTLVPWGFAQFDRAALRFLSDLQAEGFTLGFLSNGRERPTLRADLNSHPLLFRARKPLRAGFIRLFNALKLPPSQVAMVGDQVLTDILGAKRWGSFAILVRSVDPAREPRLIRLRRWAEGWILGLLIHSSD